jgi:hypothetical protein
MRRSRYAPSPIEKSRVTANEVLILQSLYRYRYLDTAHIRSLTGWKNANLHKGLKRLYGAGLVSVLPNNLFRRDRLTAPLVYEITLLGVDYLEGHGQEIPQATWLRGRSYGNPDHNLKLCLSLCSIELACKDTGHVFHPWGEILAAAPETTQQLSNPHRFEMNGRRLVPDALFSIEYTDHFACFAYELDITNHGETEYREKFDWYHDLIFDGFYKKHLGMTQKMFVLTATITPARMINLLTYLPKRATPFLVKAIPEYGLFDKAPAPNLSIMDEWHTAKRQLVSLNGGDLVGHTKIA